MVVVIEYLMLQLDKATPSRFFDVVSYLLGRSSRNRASSWW